MSQINERRDTAVIVALATGSAVCFATGDLLPLDPDWSVIVGLPLWIVGFALGGLALNHVVSSGAWRKWLLALKPFKAWFKLAGVMICFSLAVGWWAADQRAKFGMYMHDTFPPPPSFEPVARLAWIVFAAGNAVIIGLFLVKRSSPKVSR